MARTTETTGDETALSRRSLLASAVVGFGSVGAFSGVGRAQNGTDEPDGGAQIYTRAIVPRVGEPYEGQYVGQYILFTDPTPDDEVDPAIVGECDFAEWEQSETRGYQGLLVDRLTDEPRGVEIPMYTNGTKERVDVGETFIVNRVESCGEDFIGVELEAVPVEQFRPNYDTDENPLVGEEPGPGVSPTQDGDAEGPGQPGFGIVAAVVGLGVAGLVRTLIRDRGT